MGQATSYSSSSSSVSLLGIAGLRVLGVFEFVDERHVFVETVRGFDACRECGQRAVSGGRLHDPDGTLAASTEFTNDLDFSAGYVLGTLLAGERSAGRWIINLLAVGSLNDQENSPCVNSRGNDVACKLGRDDVEVSTEGVSPDRVVVLRGSFEADQDGQINAVETRAATCDGSVAPDDCGGPQAESDISGVTETGDTSSTAEPLAQVGAGQIVQVEVELSFGTLP